MRLLLLIGLLLFSVPVGAEQVAVIWDGPDSIELHDRLHGKCPRGVAEARYVWKDGKTVDGCWKVIVNRDAVYVIFVDGDAFLIPISKWTWKAGKRPATL